MSKEVTELDVRRHLARLVAQVDQVEAEVCDRERQGWPVRTSTRAVLESAKLVADGIRELLDGHEKTAE